MQTPHMPYEYVHLKEQNNSLLQYIDEKQDTFIIGMKGLEYLQTNKMYADILKPLHITAQWAQDFLSNPHPELGRKGAVCPYTKPSMDKELFWLSLYSKRTSTPAEVRSLLIKYQEIFNSLAPVEGKETQFKTILVVFPHFTQQDCNELIDNVQYQLKREFVSQGLMIGQFHAHCPQGGLWNPDFRVLRSPLPMLVIRKMVVSDYPFLEHDEEMVKSWVSIFPETYQNYLIKHKTFA
jgi:hypothetical protein